MRGPIKEFEAKLRTIQSDIDKNRFAQAFNSVEKLLSSSPFVPNLLVLRAQLLQLLDEDDGPDLSNVDDDLNAALAIDNKNVEAWIELGEFQLNVQDDPQQALGSFDKARELLKAWNLELGAAYLKTLQELNCNIQKNDVDDEYLDFWMTFLVLELVRQSTRLKPSRAKPDWFALLKKAFSNEVKHAPAVSR
jgi:tetratricopeptide (TPR) repeat protein